MLCKKQSAIIIIIKLTSYSKTDSGPSLEESTPAPLLFSKIVKTPAGVYQRRAQNRTWSDWIRTEANFGRFRTGSDCNFFEN